MTSRWTMNYKNNGVSYEIGSFFHRRPFKAKTFLWISMSGPRGSCTFDDLVGYFVENIQALKFYKKNFSYSIKFIYACILHLRAHFFNAMIDYKSCWLPMGIVLPKQTGKLSIATLEQNE